MVSVPDITQPCDKSPFGLRETKNYIHSVFHMAKHSYSKIIFQSPSPFPFIITLLYCNKVFKQYATLHLKRKKLHVSLE